DSNAGISPSRPQSSQLRFLRSHERIPALGLGAFFAHTGHSAAKLGLFLVAGALLDYRAGPPRNPRAEWEGVTMIERNRIHSVLVVILLLAISIGCQQRDATSGSDASAPS